MVPVDQYLISPLYRIIEEHQAAAAFLVISALVFWWARKARPDTRRGHVYAFVQPARSWPQDGRRSHGVQFGGPSRARFRS